MRRDHFSLRAWLALLLVGSTILFFVGISLERGALAGEPALSSNQLVASQPAEGAGGDGGEAGHSPAAAESGGEVAGETAAGRDAEFKPFGIDLEAPLLVGAAIVGSLGLALLVAVTTSLLVPLAIVGFAVVFAVLDLLEVVHQLGLSHATLVGIAVVLVVAHIVVGLLAARLLTTGRKGQWARRSLGQT